MLELFGLEGPKDGFTASDNEKLKGGLDYYENIVHGLIKKNVHNEFRNNILRDDEKLSFLTYKVMMADISYNGNGTLEGWRKECFKYAIGNIISKINNKPEVQSLSDIMLGSVQSRKEHSEMEINDLLSCLSDREQAVLKNKFLNGKTMEEIGEENGITKQRVEQIIKSATKKIREKYETEVNR